MQEALQRPSRPQAPPINRAEGLALQGLMIALSALSQRFTVALAELVALGYAFSVFALAWTVVDAPSVLRLVGLGLYAVFVLVLLFVIRGRYLAS